MSTQNFLSTVYLVGAGPGDPGLLTLRAQAVLQSAQVVLYDHLVNPAIFEQIHPDAELIYVGKKPYGESTPQAAIEELLFEKSQVYQRVVRLKGGDPYVFGRGAEENLFLQSRGVHVEVVPGITTALALGAYAGIPLTHRSLNNSVQFIAATSPDAVPESDARWGAWASSKSTLVFYMGVKQAAYISRQLIHRGLSPNTPAALIENLSLPQQRSIQASLADLPQVAAEAGIGMPAILVIGEVVALQSELLPQAQTNKPLVWLTQAKDSLVGLSSRLQTHGLRVQPLPLIELKAKRIEDLDPHAFDRFSQSSYLLFTSAYAVKPFLTFLQYHGADLRSLAGKKILSIGPATTQALQAIGLQADLSPNVDDGSQLLEIIISTHIDNRKYLISKSEKPQIFYPCSDLSQHAWMHDARVTLYALPVYENQLPKTFQMPDTLPDLTFFASRSAVEQAESAFNSRTLQHLKKESRAVAIGNPTARALTERGYQSILVSRDFTTNSIAETILLNLQGQATHG